MRYNIYLRPEIEESLHTVFEYLKLLGDIPVNATEIGEYRAQCISFAVRYLVADIQDKPREVKYGETS